MGASVRWLTGRAIGWLVWWVLGIGWDGGSALWGRAATLSDPEVDAYNLRLGTQTFSGRYQFTTNSLLVETAEAIRGMGSDIVKFYLGRGWDEKYRITLRPSINSLTALARDEPSCRRVLDMPFRHVFLWAYCFSPGADAYWSDGVSASERQKEYSELYTFATYLLTTYNHSGKSFYLGHWEGDWHLLPDYQTTRNPSPTAIQGMRDWLNTRQQAVDDAVRDTPHSDVHVYVYTEVNRVRDAMLNGSGSNQRVVNQVLPAVTNLDLVSWSAYDGQDLPVAELTRTLNYVESQLSTNKAALIPGKRVFVGEYGWGGSLSSAAQEPRTRAFARNLLEWGAPFVLFWEIYNNEAGRAYWLIDSAGMPTPCYELHRRYANRARLSVAAFRQSHSRLPDDREFADLMGPILGEPLPAPVPMSVDNGLALEASPTSARVEGLVEAGVYGGELARVWLHWGKVDGGNQTDRWEHSVDLGLQTRFGPVSWSALISDLDPAGRYFFRFRAVQSTGETWAPDTATFRLGRARPTIRASVGGDGAVQVQVQVQAGAEIGDVAPDLLLVQLAESLDSLGSPIAWQTVFAARSPTLPFTWTVPTQTAGKGQFIRILFDP